MHDFVSVKEKMPEIGQQVEVLRDFKGAVVNPGHPSHGCRFGIERTEYLVRFGFLCDMESTGTVTHWRQAGSLKIASLDDYPRLKAFFEGIAPGSKD